MDYQIWRNNKEVVMANWWRLNPKHKATYDIEWDSQSGMMRCRINDGKIKTKWETAKAHDCRHAEALGLALIDKIRARL